MEENIELVCEGLDTLAEIYVNHERVFYADNMHRTWRIPVKAWLKQGKNQIEIVFLSALNYIDNYRCEENKETAYVPSGAVKGNFRDIYLESWTGRKIKEVKLRQDLEKELAWLTAAVVFSEPHREQHNQRVRFSVKEKDNGKIVGEAEELLGESSVWEKRISVPEPKLWWPNGYGEQPLYEAVVTFLNQDGG